MAFFFPEWIPWWLQLAIVGVVIIFGVCFLLMPFSVFGLKSRLTYLDHQMEDIQAQLRVLLKRIPDARERLEFKLQPVSTSENEAAAREERASRERKSASATDYYSAVPSTKSRPTCFDPPSQSEATPVDASSKTAVYDDTKDFVTDNRVRARVTESVQERMSTSGRREEQIYNPPPRPVREEKQEEPQQRRRAEPILRWPPR